MLLRSRQAPKHPRAAADRLKPRGASDWQHRSYIEEGSIGLTTIGSCSDGSCDWLSRRSLWQGRQRGGHSAAQSAGLPGIRCCRVPSSCNRTEHPGCVQRILALPAFGLGDRMVEHRHRNLRDCGRLPLVTLCRRQASARRHGTLVLVFGVSILFFPKDRSLTREAADTPEVLRPAYWLARLVAVAIGVGLISGLLANAGGFLLVPCNHALSQFRASRPPVGYQSRPLRDNDYELCIGRLLVYALCVCWYMFSVRIQC